MIPYNDQEENLVSLVFEMGDKVLPYGGELAVQNYK